MAKEKVALITGITGQDGAYLAEFLLNKGYIVHGIKRRASQFNTERIDHIYQDPHLEKRRFILHYGDMTDSLNITDIIQKSQPDEIYNLAAQSHVQVSFETPEYTANVDALGTLRILEAVRLLGMEKRTRIYQASTSELYGKVQEIPQTETTPFYPRSPYAAAKLYAYWITVNYREAYNMYACNGILFNHESPIRGETFVTRKITRAAVNIALGRQETLYIGNMDAQRDWGHAKDYVEAMWLMLQQDAPEDFVIATGITTSVRDVVRIAFEEAGYNIRFENSGEDEVGVIDSIIGIQEPAGVSETLSDSGTTSAATSAAKASGEKDNERQVNGAEGKLMDAGKSVAGKGEDVALSSVRKPGDVVVKVDPAYFRPTEVDQLIGDAAKARKKLGWKPEHDLKSLICEMVQSDMKKLSAEPGKPAELAQPGEPGVPAEKPDA